MDLIGFGELSKESFEIVEELGCGSCGTVYKARQLGLDRLVALKVLQQTDEVSLTRFHREAQILAQLKHKNICQCFHFGVEMGVPFMALELIEAPTLRSIMGGNQIDWKQGAEIGIQVCAGLQAAHEMGVIHRDIKPDNIMIMPDGTVKILDFGLSGYDSESAQKLTQAHVTLGTPPYMSPEQCTAGRLDARSDIYALGCLLFECVAGTPPFSGETISTVMLKHESMDPPPLEEYATVPAGYEFIVRKALSKDPGRRYQSAKDLGWALSDLLDDPGAPVPKRKSASGLSSRKALGYVLPAALAVTLICGFAVAFRPAALVPEPAGSGNGLLRGSRHALYQVSQLWEEKGDTSKEQARELLKKVILAEESQAHPDNNFLLNAYMLTGDMFDPVVAEIYLRKAVVLSRNQPGRSSLHVLRSLSLLLEKQGKPAKEFLLELSSLATANEARDFAGFAAATLCQQYSKEGRLKESESYGVKACTQLAGLPGGWEVNLYCQTIGALMLLGTESARKTADEQLLHLSNNQIKLVENFVVGRGWEARQPVVFLQCVDALARIDQKRGLTIDKLQRFGLIKNAERLNSEYPASQRKIVLAMRNIIPVDEAMWLEMNPIYRLLDSKDVATAELLVEDCRRRFQQKKDWPYSYQGYLDKLKGQTRKDESRKLRALVPLYDANLPRLLKAYGPESQEYARALWQRAHLNKELNNQQASWRDFDACERIVAKISVSDLNVHLIRTYKATVSAGRH